MKSPEFVKIERCHKTGSSTNSSCHDTFVIVIDNLPHAMRYRLWRSTRWKFEIRIKTFPFLSFGIRSLLRSSSLQIFYAANLRHTCLVPMPFKFFPRCDQFAREKSGCFLSKFSKFCYCNRNCESSIVLNN